ncbi:hypothetical protein ACTMU2_28775 [Cupriavidus basilensis]
MVARIGGRRCEFAVIPENVGDVRAVRAHRQHHRVQTALCAGGFIDGSDHAATVRASAPPPTGPAGGMSASELFMRGRHGAV